MVEELYAVYFEELRRYFVRQAHDPATAEDLVQETFLKAMEHEQTLRNLTDSKRRAWLYRCGKNLLIDRIRHRKREPDLQEEGVYREDLSGAIVQQLLGALSERDRSIFILRHFEGYSAVEIADIFQMTSENVRTRLSLARKLLKVEWERC